VVFRVHGIGQFRAIGPTGNIDELRTQWESAVARFEELTAGFGTNDIATLEKLHAQADELDKQIAQVEVKITTILDGESIDNLRGSRLRAASTLDEILREHPEWEQASPDPAKISKHADETEKQFTNDIGSAEAANDRAQEVLRLGLQKQSSHQAETARLEAHAAAVEKRLELLRNDGLEDKQRTEDLTQIALRRDTAQGKLSLVEEKIQELGDDPSKSLAVLEGQLEAFRAAAADADRKLNTESGRLEQIIADAPYSALANDDVFTYTDTTRLARIATILDETAERFQIVLLTCHPERYRGLPRAEFLTWNRFFHLIDGASADALFQAGLDDAH